MPGNEGAPAQKVDSRIRDDIANTLIYGRAADIDRLTNYQLPISYTFAPGHGVLTVRMGISGEPGYLESRARKRARLPARPSSATPTRFRSRLLFIGKAPRACPRQGNRVNPTSPSAPRNLPTESTLSVLRLRSCQPLNLSRYRESTMRWYSPLRSLILESNLSALVVEIE